MKGIIGGTDDGLRRMSKLHMLTIDVFLQGGIANAALLLFASQMNSTLATQPSLVLVQHLRIILPFVELSTMLFLWSLDIVFLCKSLHIREKGFACASGQNFMGQRV